MKSFRILLPILCICILCSTLTAGNLIAQFNSSENPVDTLAKADTTKYTITAEQLKKTAMLIEENKTLKKNVRSWQVSDSVWQTKNNVVQSELDNCKKTNDLKEIQLRQIEKTPFATTVIVPRKWYELPLATTVGVVVGIVVGVLFINK